MNKSFVFLISLFFLFSLPSFGLEYDYSSTRAIPIELSPMVNLSTKEGIIEGETIPLRVVDNVYESCTLILKRNDIVKAKIETVITAGMNGFPAEIILNDFEIPGIHSSKLMSEYSKTGQNRCLWVYPLKIILTPLYPSGSLTNFIKGGHAKLTSSDRVMIYYYPGWK